MLNEEAFKVQESDATRGARTRHLKGSLALYGDQKQIECSKVKCSNEYSWCSNEHSSGAS